MDTPQERAVYEQFAAESDAWLRQSEAAQIRVPMAQSTRAPPRPTIFQLQVIIEGISPPIWRQLQVHSDITLH